MADRRMFSKKITEADAFTGLPPTTQALYFHLCMGADDDGFSNQIRKAMFNAHADTNDFNLLVSKRFIIPFESGVIVIKHWRMHNLIKSDRYHETDYIEEKARIVLKKNGVYTENHGGTQMEPERSQTGTQMEPQVRLGKDSIGKVRSGKDRVGEDKVEVIDKPAGQQQGIPTLPILDGPEWRPEQKDLQEWQSFYSRVDVLYELGRMRQWCLSNPAKRKTAYEIRGFVTKWLDQEQRKVRPQQATGADAYYELAMEASNGTG